MKKILILNGNPDKGNIQFDRYISDLAETLAGRGHELNVLLLRDMALEDCTGCYSCWLRTPGRCVLKDDQSQVLAGYVWADVAVLASPVGMGYLSSKIKKSQDRLIPLVHPFLRLDGDRMAHLPRYEKTAQVGLLLESGPDLDKDTFEIIGKANKGARFVRTTEQTVGEVADEIDGI